MSIPSSDAPSAKPSRLIATWARQPAASRWSGERQVQREDAAQQEEVLKELRVRGQDARPTVSASAPQAHALPSRMPRVASSSTERQERADVQLSVVPGRA